MLLGWEVLPDTLHDGYVLKGTVSQHVPVPVEDVERLVNKDRNLAETVKGQLCRPVQVAILTGNKVVPMQGVNKVKPSNLRLNRPLNLILIHNKNMLIRRHQQHFGRIVNPHHVDLLGNLDSEGLHSLRYLVACYRAVVCSDDQLVVHFVP